MPACYFSCRLKPFTGPLEPCFSVHLSVYETLYPFAAGILGAAFSWSIPMAYTAVGQTPDLTCWLLYFGNLAWTVAYDTQYAITDREYDLKIGVKSTAILFGQHDIQIISTLQVLSLVLIGTALWIEDLLVPFGLMGLLAVAIDFIYQWSKTRDKDPQRCFWPSGITVGWG